MISAAGLSGKKLGDVTHGHLVFARIQDQSSLDGVYRFGIIVRQAGRTVPDLAPLGLPGRPEVFDGNVRTLQGATCLDLGRGPLLEWDGATIIEKPANPARPNDADAKLGHIYLGPAGPLLCMFGTTNFMWNLTTKNAELYSRPHLELGSWHLGIPDDNGKMMHVLAHFPGIALGNSAAIIAASRKP